MDKYQDLLRRATLAIARRLDGLDEDVLQAIVENEKYLCTFINNDLGTRLRREALFFYDSEMHSLDDDEVQFAIQEASCYDYSLMSELCRTELERNLVEMRRRLQNANANADDFERRYRRAITD